MLPSACLHGCPAGQVWLARRVFKEREREGERARERGYGELLHSEEEFCSADDYTCRADAAPAAGVLAAKVTKPGWHRQRAKGTGRAHERTRLSLCEARLQQEVFGV